jgi:predicted nucleic acid-binding protein
VFDFCRALLEQPNAAVTVPGARHWSIFADLCAKANASGNLAQDAWFAALAIESGCEWITTDGDYARFPGLSWREPL